MTPHILFPEWQSLGYDTQSSVDSVYFANSWGGDISDWGLSSDSPGVDDGVDLSEYFTTDILGVERPKGAAWDIGALEIK